MGPGAIMTLAWAGAVLGPLVAFVCWRRFGRRRPRLTLALLVAFACVYGLCVWTFLIEPRILVVKHVAITSAEWRGPPLRIGVISDTHVSAPHVTPERVARVVERLNHERPDLAVFLGDYAGGHEPGAPRSAPAGSAILRGAAELGAADAPLGRVGVLGNHDWWYDGPALEAQLRRAGVTVLENDAVRIARPGGAFWVAGLADLESRRAEPSPEAALRQAPAGEPVVMLTHYPDPWPDVAARVALTLAGHSHCGQVNLPIVGRLAHASYGSDRWGCGHYVDGGRQLYVTGGVGTSILPVRFRAPPEIVIVTLSRRP